MTSAERMTNAMPVTTLGMLNAVFMLPAMELIWLMLPMPNDASTQKQENSAASTRPRVLQPFFAPRPSAR